MTENTIFVTSHLPNRATANESSYTLRSVESLNTEKLFFASGDSSVKNIILPSPNISTFDSNSFPKKSFSTTLRSDDASAKNVNITSQDITKKNNLMLSVPKKSTSPTVVQMFGDLNDFKNSLNRDENEVKNNSSVLNEELTCGICIDKYNKTNKVPIKCEYCEFTACRKCCTTFILNEAEPKCMNTSNCNRTWTRQFISSKMTKSFINNDFKKHKEQLLYERERSLLPATQPLVEHQIRLEKIEEEINELNISLLKIKDNIRDKLNERSRGIRLFNNNTENIATQRVTFIRACPDNECRGFLSSQWKCGLCEKWTCSQCYVIKGTERNMEQHVCDAGDIETAALILKETKSCPNCGMGIFKIDGCDQMFCTECNTAFNWKTGKIQTNNIHNPHYFEWLRRNEEERPNENIENIPVINECNDDRNDFVLNHYVCTRLRQHVLVKYNFEVSETIKGKLVLFDKIVRRAIHLSEVDIMRYNYGLNLITYNQDLRIKYLRKQIDEEQFKVLLQRKDKRKQKNNEIYNILQMVYNVTVDIIYRISVPVSRNTHWDESVFDPLKEITELVKYANECLVDVAKTYDVRPLLFDNYLKLM